jgi:DNA-binding response OmpR family regulator
MSLKPVLYAEDEENDAFFFKRAFKQAQILNPLIVVPDGQAAIDYCSDSSPFTEHSQHPLPQLILLDLKMPKKSGMEVLQWLRQQSSVSTLPVVMLSSSTQDEDIHLAYRNGANGYLVKPSDPEELQLMVRAIHDYWLKQNRQTLKPWNQLPLP